MTKFSLIKLKVLAYLMNKVKSWSGKSRFESLLHGAQISWKSIM